jgi:transketolase
VARGAYVLRDPDGPPDVLLVASGSEVSVALEAADQLPAARVVSMPSWELFGEQPLDYRKAVLPPNVPAISVEAGVEQGWSHWVSGSASIERFGASAPGPTVLSQLGVTPARVLERVREVLG